MRRRSGSGVSRGRVRLFYLSQSVAQVMPSDCNSFLIEAVGCVGDIPRLDRHTWLICDTSEIEPCCVRAMAAWRHRRAGFLQILFLDDETGKVTGPGVGRLQARPGMSLDRLMTFLATRGFMDDARRAGYFPPDLSGAACAPPLASALLDLIDRRATASLSVATAARVLQVTPRRLHRLTLRLFGQPPHVFLGLGRVRAVARALRSRSVSLERIAEEFGFTDVGTMSRMFFRYVGIRPGAYRTRSKTLLSDCAIDRPERSS